MDVRAAHLERPCASSLWARGRLPRATRCSSCAPAPRRSSGPSAPRAVLNLRHERLRTARVSAVRYSIPTWRAERTSCSWRSLRDKPPNSMSRWSSTSVPSVATGLPEAGVGASGSGAQESSGNPPNESPVESQTLIAPRASPGAGASPASIRLSIPPSPYLTADGAPLSHSQRSSSNAATGESLHVHPVLEDFESPTDSLPISTSEIRFRHPSDSDEGHQARGELPLSDLRRPNRSSMPDMAEEYRPRPFDPSVLVNRVLGLPSPTSSTTPRPNHSRTQSNLAISSTRTSPFPASPRHDSSNEQLGNNRPGQS